MEERKLLKHLTIKIQIVLCQTYDAAFTRTNQKLQVKDISNGVFGAVSTMNNAL